MGLLAKSLRTRHPRSRWQVAARQSDAPGHF